MQRRRLLYALPFALIPAAGCTVDIGDPSSPLAASKSVRLADAMCQDSADEYQHRATATYDGSTRDLEITGVLKGEYPCSDLFIDVLRGTGHADIPDNAVLIDIDIEGHGDCDPCQSAELHYEATVHFNRDPNSARIYHIEKVGTEWKRKGPITTAKIR